jgi:hypothetical protein
MTTPMPDVQARFQQALDSLIEKVRKDPYIVAAVLLGSLSYDTVWEKSDIDLCLVTDEVKQKNDGLCLVEDGINIHAFLRNREEFRKMMEGAIQSSFSHSLMSHGRLLFSHDDTIRRLFENAQRLGARDREIQLLNYASWVIPSLTKAEKWLRVRNDPHYSFFWIMKTLDGLASVEVVLNGEVTKREVIQQALRHNPEFFRVVYLDLIDGPKTVAAMERCTAMIEGYLMERMRVLFGPILEFLAEAEGVRSTSELNHHFKNQMGLSGLDTAYEWLADQGIIEKVSSPVRLTAKSRIDVAEAAYYYSGEPRE